MGHGWLSEYYVHDIADSEFTNYKKILKMVVEAKDCMCYCQSKTIWHNLLQSFNAQ